ncbi:MAG: hypothetical protein QOE91_1429, partial [Gaiellaceae bacterium]|nr:hypothetical protein [Gaiellaceae bacterium]
RWLHPDDASTESKQLAARERARQVLREIDDEEACQWLHSPPNL